MKSLYTLLLLLGAVCFLQAQTIAVKGVVQDRDNEKAVPFAWLTINQVYVFSDENGAFEATIPEAEMLDIVCSQIGYEEGRWNLPAKEAGSLRLWLQAQAVSLEPIIVTGQPRYSAPQSNVVSDPEKAVSQPRDVGDLFNEIPGFGVVKKGGFALDPVFRGFKYEQINVQYDGGTQTTHACPNRMDPVTTHVDPQDVQMIEVIKGPFSVRYGPAMGPIVNVVTHSIAGDGSLEPITAFAEGGYESNSNSWLARAGIGTNQKHWDLLASGGLKNFGNYHSGDGTEIPSSFQSYEYSLKGGYKPAANHRIQANWRQAFQRDVLHAGLMMDTDTDDSYLLSLDYQGKNLGKHLYGIVAKAYGSQVDHVMSNLRRPNFPTMEAVATVQAQQAGGRLEASWMLGQKFFLYTGADTRYLGRTGDRVRILKKDANGNDLPQPKTFVDGIWQESALFNTGLFAEGRYFIGPDWTLAGGLRMDYADASIGAPAENFQEYYGDDLDVKSEYNLGGTVSLSFLNEKGWKAQIALGRGVRSANMIERFINHFQVGNDAYEYVGNPNLVPEANHQAEFSFGKQGDKLQASANVFYSYITDYITAAVDTTLVRKYAGGPPYARRFINIDEAEKYGFEISAKYTVIKHLCVLGSLAYTYAQNLEWDEPLAEIPPLEGVLGVKYERPVWWVDARARLVSAQGRVSVIFDESTTEGFQVFDLRAGVTPVKGLSIGAALLNVFDQNYREHLNREYKNLPETGVILEPGRNATVFVKYQF